MLAIISPAKSMEMPKVIPNLSFSSPVFTQEIATLLTSLKKLKKKDLMEMMEISEKLAELNEVRYKSFNTDFSLANGASPALLAFTGEVYLGLDAKSFSNKELLAANEKISILSGFYGLLRPLDLIQPYRLEMGRNIKVGKTNNLYQFWGKKIADEVNQRMEQTKSKYLINLASDEYFKSIKPYIEDQKIIHINFKEEKAGSWSFISFNAKKARGLMCRYIVKSKAKTPEQLKSFDYEHYQFNESLSSENGWIFTRKFVPVGKK